MLDGFLLGIEVALSWQGLLACTVGVTLGMIIGVLPGVGVLAAVSLLLPLTFSYPPAIGRSCSPASFTARLMEAPQHRSC